MKTLLLKLIPILMIVSGIATQSKAQWIQGGASQNWYLQPTNNGNSNNWTRSIGIGYFTTSLGTTYPNSFLHINTNGMLLPGNGSITTLGEVFRTDCPAANDPFWRMFRGGTPIARLFNLATDNDLRIETVQLGSNILFRTGGIQHMILTDGTVPGLAGRLGIGTQFTDPQSLLHLHDGIYSTYLQITNANTTGGNIPTQTSGFKFGIDATGIAEIRQQENLEMQFFTFNTERMRIRANGSVDIGSIPSMPASWWVTAGDKLNVVGGDVRIGEVTNENLGLFPGYGRHLLFSGGPDDVDPNRNSDNTDPLWIARLNFANDASRLRVYIGDNTGPTATMRDMLEIGGSYYATTPTCNPLTDPNCWISYMVVGDGGPTGAPGRAGINTINPQNCLEINTELTPTSVVGGSSGLRFTDLTDATTPTTNTGTGVLAVDVDGDVIYVDAPTGTGFGAACTNPTPFDLSDDWRVGLANFNFIFSGEGYDNIGGILLNKVGIGNFTNCEPLAKLDVLEDAGIAVNLPGTIGLLVQNKDIFSTTGTGNINQSMKGIVSIVNGTETEIRNVHAAGLFRAANAERNYGGYFEALNYSPIQSENYGIYSRATGNSINYGGFMTGEGVSSPTGTITNYGVYGKAINGNINYGVYGNAPTVIPNNWAGYFSGHVWYTGNLTPVSDSILKENVSPILNGLNAISQLKPKQFYFKTEEYPNVNLPSGLQFGLIAQQVERILPNLVSEATQPAEYDSLGNEIYPSMTYKGINYIGLIPITIQAVKELDSIVTTLIPLPLPSKPILISPADASVDLPVDSVRLVWHKADYALEYDVHIETPYGMESITVFDTLLVIYKLGYSFEYKWCVVARNNTGKNASDTWSFTTIAMPGLPAPLLASPANGDTGVSVNPAFIWFSSIGATGYNLYISTTPDETGLIYNAYVTDTFARPVGPGKQFLKYHTTYYWWVKACNVSVCSANSEIWNFTTVTGFGVLAGQSVAELSDSRLKTNIAPLSGSLDKLKQLNGISFEWDSLQYPGVYFEQGKQLGLIAQDVQPVIPEVVKTDAQGYSYIEYNRLVPVLIESIKEQQAQIDSLKTIVMGTNQKSTGDNGNNGNQSNMQYVELVTENAIILNQNDPNPFAEETDITYHLTDDVSQAKILFYDNTGKIIKTVELIGRGDGSLHVYASNLSAGIYAYALVADGKIIDTKKMVCTKK